MPPRIMMRHPSQVLIKLALLAIDSVNMCFKRESMLFFMASVLKLHFANQPSREWILDYLGLVNFASSDLSQDGDVDA
jgi:hypothetical protein